MKTYFAEVKQALEMLPEEGFNYLETCIIEKNYRAGVAVQDVAKFLLHRLQVLDYAWHVVYTISGYGISDYLDEWGDTEIPIVAAPRAVFIGYHKWNDWEAWRDWCGRCFDGLCDVWVREGYSYAEKDMATFQEILVYAICSKVGLVDRISLSTKPWWVDESWWVFFIGGV